MPKTLTHMSRRQFLKAGTCGAMTIGPLVNTLAQLTLVNSAAASTLNNSADYKALICIFLRGGCDTNNVIIPRAGHPFAEAYALDRGAVAVSNGVIHPTYNPNAMDLTLPIASNGGEPFGLHPSLINLAEMFNNREACFVSNVGTLSEPITPTTYSTSSLPKQLFSHSDQQTQWMSSIADKPYTSGWGARVADLYNDTWNPEGQTSMLITAAGNNQFMAGGGVPQYSVTSAGAISLAGFGNNYGSALNSDGTYRQGPTGERLKALEQIMQYSHSHILEESYRTVINSARANEEQINQAVKAESLLDINFDTIWRDRNATSSFADEMKVVARLIAGRSNLGNQRQIFFVDMSGFDNHAAINGSLPGLLEDLDRGIGAFNAGMKVLAEKDSTFDYNQVTTFQASDFNRTWTPNGTDVNTAGTDHAWGSHCFVFGGAVQGGQLYGSYPELVVGGQDDVPRSSRGRWIPSTSVDQYTAVLANWFGIPINSSEMQTILPNLNRFPDPLRNETNLTFL